MHVSMQKTDTHTKCIYPSQERIFAQSEERKKNRTKLTKGCNTGSREYQITEEEFQNRNGLILILS